MLFSAYNQQKGLKMPKLSNQEMNLINELFFFHGVVFQALLPKHPDPSKKDRRIQSAREINREIKMRNCLMKQQQKQRNRNY